MRDRTGVRSDERPKAARRRRGQALLRQRHHRLHRREPPRSRPPAGELRPRPARSRRRPSGPLLRPRDAAAPAADPPGWASAQAWPPGARLFLRRPAWQHRPGGSSAANLGPAGTGGGRGRLPRRPVLRAPRDVGRGRQAPPRRRVRHFRRAGMRVIAARGGEGSGRRRPRVGAGADGGRGGGAGRWRVSRGLRGAPGGPAEAGRVCGAPGSARLGGVGRGTAGALGPGVGPATGLGRPPSPGPEPWPRAGGRRLA